MIDPCPARTYASGPVRFTGQVRFAGGPDSAFAAWCPARVRPR